MKRITFGLAILLTASLSLTATANIYDNFEADHSADYTLVTDTPSDGTANFQFDYVAAGIPLAPNSTPGDTMGLRFTANDTAGAADHLTAFHNTEIAYSSYTLTVDIFMNVNATAGSTEFAHVGVAGDGLQYNSLFYPTQGSGYYLGMTGEGGSSSDYRHSLPSGLTNSGDESYLNSTNTTQATGDTYMSIFPNTDFPGSPGNVWTTLEIDISASTGKITYSLDGTPIIQDDLEPDSTTGYVNLGYADLFGSVCAPFQGCFVVYDNLVVTPEPASLALLALGGLVVVRRRR